MSGNPDNPDFINTLSLTSLQLSVDVGAREAEQAIASTSALEQDFLRLQIRENTVYMPNFPKNHILRSDEEADIATAVCHAKDTPKVPVDQIDDRLKRLHYPVDPEINQILIPQTGMETFSLYHTYRGDKNCYYVIRWESSSTCSMVLSTTQVVPEVKKGELSTRLVLMLPNTAYSPSDKGRDEDYQQPSFYNPHHQYDEVM